MCPPRRESSDRRHGLIGAIGCLAGGLLGAVVMVGVSIDHARHVNRSTPTTAVVEDLHGEGTNGFRVDVRLPDGALVPLVQPMAGDAFRVGERIDVWRDDAEPSWVADSTRSPLTGTGLLVCGGLAVGGLLTLLVIGGPATAHGTSTPAHGTLTEPPR